MTAWRWSALVAFVSAGCATLRDELRYAEDAHARAHYDHAQVWLAALEEDVPEMTPGQRASYFYLRGMTAFRLGRRADALHYLALARETSGEPGQPGALREDWRTSMERTLAELTPQDATHRPRQNAPERD
ncbi:MAG: hypothetical protein NZ898_11155 [Myxococcota bacterium]|nr:hypothetical protein [Myxococcota bacterium]MDW8362279.1 hypothetical protein [Myxococcales bacterium]